jgi:hypothetical protein
LFAIERANIIILSAAAVCFFICYYDSERKSQRIFAAVMLAFAATLKIYPVIFGVLYFEKKQYKDIVFSFIAVLIFVFLPFLFFQGGFSNIQRIIQYQKEFASSSDGIYALSRALINVPYYCTVFLFGISVILSLFEKDIWRKITLVSLAVLYIPKTSLFYCGLYIFPALLIFFATLKTRSKLLNVIVFALFILFLNPYQLEMNNMDIVNLAINRLLAAQGGNLDIDYMTAAVITNQAVNTFIANLALIILWLVVSGMSIKTVIHNHAFPANCKKKVHEK